MIMNVLLVRGYEPTRAFWRDANPPSALLMLLAASLFFFSHIGVPGADTYLLLFDITRPALARPDIRLLLCIPKLRGASYT